MRKPLRSRVAQRVTRPIRRRLNRHSIRVAREEFIALSDAHEPALEGRITELDRRLRNLGNRVSRVEEQVAAFTREVDRSRTSAERLSAIAASAESRVVDDVSSLKQSVSSLRDAVREVSAGHERIDNRHREILEIASTNRTTLGLLFGPTRSRRTRLISDPELNALVDGLSFIGDDARVITALHQAFGLVLELEQRCAGGFAGSTPNVLARLAALSILEPPSGDVLEVGTLSGLGAAGVARQLARSGLDYHLTLVDQFVDRLVGNGESSMDGPAGAPSVAVVASNLALAGVPQESYRVIDGISTSPDVRSAANDRKYGVIVIDREQTEDATYADLVWAEDVAAPGALVLVDHVGDPVWPGVEAALDRSLSRQGSRLRRLGRAATCAFLRAD